MAFAEEIVAYNLKYTYNEINPTYNSNSDSENYNIISELKGISTLTADISNNEIKTTTESSVPPKKPFGSVARLHYKYALHGENELTLSAFHLFLNSFFVLGVADFIEKIDDSDFSKFANANYSIYLGRSFSEKSSWGKAFCWVARYQPFRKETPDILSAGLQWTLSETPGMVRENSSIPWKSFIQLYVKESRGVGSFDIFHWYQFNLKKNIFYIRGNNAYYIIPHKRDGIQAVQDLIFPANDHIELYLRHFYQNIQEIDIFHSTGSQFLLGIRFSY